MSNRGSAGGSSGAAERRPLMLAARVPRSYGSLFYYKFVRDAMQTETLQTEVGYGYGTFQSNW